MFHYLSIIYQVAAVIFAVVAILLIIKAIMNKILLKKDMVPIWNHEAVKYLIKLDSRLAIILIIVSLFLLGTAIAMEYTWTDYVNNIKTSQIQTQQTDLSNPNINQ